MLRIVLASLALCAVAVPAEATVDADCRGGCSVEPFVCWENGPKMPCSDPCEPGDLLGVPIYVVCYGPPEPGTPEYCADKFQITCWCQDLVVTMICMPS